MSETEVNDSSQKSSHEDDPPSEEKKPYERRKKIKELLEQDGETSPWADPFMGF